MSHGGVKSAKSAKNGNGAQAPESPREGSESLPPPPDGGWGWIVVFASFMIHIVSEYFQFFLLVFHVGDFDSEIDWVSLFHYHTDIIFLLYLFCF